MSTTTRIILHHYELSPYAEKVRSMLGFKALQWHSVLSPEMPPRPNIDPLSGGYRRIPIMQIGADIFCDSTVIVEEIASITLDSSMAREGLIDWQIALVDRAEKEIFFAVANSSSPLKSLGTVVSKMGLRKSWRFLKDRAGMMKGARMRLHSREKSIELLDSFFVDVNERLDNSPFLGGEEPNLCDFAVYNPVWFYTVLGGSKLPETCSALIQWSESMARLGHADRVESDQAFAFEQALQNPRPQGPALAAIRPARAVAINPDDYALDPVKGELVAESDTRWIIARNTADFGTLHVHFPKRGFELHES